MPRKDGRPRTSCQHLGLNRFIEQEFTIHAKPGTYTLHCPDCHTGLAVTIT